MSFVRTSGGKGLHVVVPLNPGCDWSIVKPFARAFAESMATREPRAMSPPPARRSARAASSSTTCATAAAPPASPPGRCARGRARRWRCRWPGKNSAGSSAPTPSTSTACRPGWRGSQEDPWRRHRRSEAGPRRGRATAGRTRRLIVRRTGARAAASEACQLLVLCDDDQRNSAAREGTRPQETIMQTDQHHCDFRRAGRARRRDPTARRRAQADLEQSRARHRSLRPVRRARRRDRPPDDRACLRPGRLCRHELRRLPRHGQGLLSHPVERAQVRHHARRLPHQHHPGAGGRRACLRRRRISTGATTTGTSGCTTTTSRRRATFPTCRLRPADLQPSEALVGIAAGPVRQRRPAARVACAARRSRSGAGAGAKPDLGCGRRSAAVLATIQPDPLFQRTDHVAPEAAVQGIHSAPLPSSDAPANAEGRR